MAEERANDKVRFQFEADPELTETIHRLQQETGHHTFAALMREAISWYGDTHILTEHYGAPVFRKPEDGDPPAVSIVVGIFPKLSLRWESLRRSLDRIDERH